MTIFTVCFPFYLLWKQTSNKARFLYIVLLVETLTAVVSNLFSLWSWSLKRIKQSSDSQKNRLEEHPRNISILLSYPSTLCEGPEPQIGNHWHWRKIYVQQLKNRDKIFLDTSRRLVSQCWFTCSASSIPTNVQPNSSTSIYRLKEVCLNSLFNLQLTWWRAKDDSSFLLFSAKSCFVLISIIYLFYQYYF